MKNLSGERFLEKFDKLLDAYSITGNKMAEDVGISVSTVTRWRQRNASPNPRMLRKICEYFKIPVEYFMEDEPLEKEGRVIMNMMYDKPELRVLFSAAQNVEKEDILDVAKILRRLKN